MTTIIVPELNKESIDDLRERLSKLSELDLTKIETPSLKQVGKTADKTINRLLGRSKRPVWPWLATGIGLVAVIGIIGAWFAFLRRPAVFSSRPVAAGDSTIETFGAVDLAENEGMTPYTPVDAFGSEEQTTSLRSNGSAIQDS
jgi:hypothetical protein